MTILYSFIGNSIPDRHSRLSQASTSDAVKPISALVVAKNKENKNETFILNICIDEYNKYCVY